MSIGRLEVTISKGVVTVVFATEHGPVTLRLTAPNATDISVGIEDLIFIANTSRPIIQAYASILSKQLTESMDDDACSPESPNTGSPGFSTKSYPMKEYNPATGHWDK